MTTSTTSTTTTTTAYTYEWSETFGAYVVLVDGRFLRNDLGNVRLFATPNSARKRIARERSGNFHS